VFERIFERFPDLALEPKSIVIGGPPWDTHVAVRFGVHATLAGGERYENEGMQFLRVRWGRVAEDRLYEDTQKLAHALARIAEENDEKARPPGRAPSTPVAS
jgi:ketosteroid isomerase-like protein